MSRRVVAVVGGGERTPDAALRTAERVGELVAERGWALVCGGRDVGVMHAAARGAHRKGGLVLGILPTKHADGGASEHLDVRVFTGMGDARNAIIGLTAEVMIACHGAEGTASEVGLALKNGRPVVLLGFDDRGLFQQGKRAALVHVAKSPEDAVAIAARLLGG